MLAAPLLEEGKLAPEAARVLRELMHCFAAFRIRLGNPTSWFDLEQAF
jgi:hypothetical protein